MGSVTRRDVVRWAGLAWLALATAAWAEAPAQLAPYLMVQRRFVDVAGGLTKVTTETDGPASGFGAFPLRVFIDNTTGPTQRLSLTYTSHQQHPAKVTREVNVEAGTRRTVTLAIPFTAPNGVVSALGPGLTDVRSASVSFQLDSNQKNHLVLCLGRAEAYAALVDAQPSLPVDDSVPDTNRPTTEVLVLPPTDAPLEPMAYSGFSAVVIPSGEAFEVLTEGQRAALEAHVLTGGTVLISGATAQALTSFPLAAARPDDVQQVGFGKLVLVERKVPNMAWLWAHTPVTPEDPRVVAKQLLPEVNAPRLRFILIIAAFTAVMGLGSLWVLRRHGPGAVLLWIPSVSAATCIVFGLTSLLLDGFTTRAAVYGYTHLDVARHRAITVGLAGYFANLPPSGIAMTSNTSIFGAPYRYDAPNLSLDWSAGLAVTNDFLPSRTYREWGFASVEPTRARLGVTRRADGWYVQNALGGMVRKVTVDLDGSRFMAERVADGAEAKLEAGAEGGPGVPDGPAQRFAARVQGPLPRNTFHAVLEGQGFAPTGGLTLVLHEGLHEVRGEVSR